MDKHIAEQYFSSLNRICRGIIKQRLNFSSLLGDQWDSLPVEEQDALLDEHFLPPSIKQKYGKVEEDDELPKFFPALKIESGQRIVEDDEGDTWQDEHSGPFSWETLSQSEFSFEDDMSGIETTKNRFKDPKRPKSPRLMRAGSGEHIAPRPGDLERASSTDFQQLRHLWETHHSVTPDSEMPPSLTSFLSRSHNSLNGELTGLSYSKRAMSSCSVDSIKERDDELDETNKRPSIDTSRDANTVLEQDEGSNSLTDNSKVSRSGESKSEATQHQTAPLATKEDDNDIMQSMNDDILKMTAIKTQIEETMSDEPITEQKPSVSANQVSTSTDVINEKTEEEDILVKYGVTFSYDKPDQPAKKSAEVKSTDESSSTTLPAGFDFLSAW